MIIFFGDVDRWQAVKFLTSAGEQGDAEESEEDVGRPGGKEDGDGAGVAEGEHHPLKEVVGDTNKDTDSNADGGTGATATL